MDYKEAKEWLEFEVFEEGHCSFIEEEVKVAIQALEKQIPKFVGCKGWNGYRGTRYTCPACKKLVRRHEPYCHSCGQAIKFPKTKVVDNCVELDWSEK